MNNTNEITIEIIKKLAGIGNGSGKPKPMIFFPENADIEQMKKLLDKLKSIDGSEGENWTEVCIGDVRYRATGITNINSRNS